MSAGLMRAFTRAAMMRAIFVSELHAHAVSAAEMPQQLEHRNES
jgi:hypothetical protein